MTAALGLTAVMTLSGCSISTGSDNSGDQPPVGAATETSPKSAGEDSATPPPLKPVEQLAKQVTSSLTKLGQTASAPTKEQMKAAMLEAGADPRTLEVSIDITPTGLAVDAIEAAAQLDKQCVIGQVRDGKAKVTTLPVLGTGLCFVGNQH